MFHICQNESRGLPFVPDLFMLRFPHRVAVDLRHVAGNGGGNHAALQTFCGCDAVVRLQASMLRIS
jgi:hypothetical protein